MNDIQLDVMIATYGADGIQRVAKMNLPHVDGVRYLVSWQLGGAVNPTIPVELQRGDVKVITSDTKGLSCNRNLLLRAVEAPICLVADDDLEYKPGQLQAIIDTYKAHPEMDLAVFKNENPNKFFPPKEMDISKRTMKGHNVVSVEISFRREKVQGRVRFNENLGVGASLPSGEEVVFLHDCRVAGLKCHYFPIFICKHNGVATGARKMTLGVARAEGVVIRYIYGLRGLPRIPLNAWRSWRQGRIGLAKGLWGYAIGFFTSI